MGFGHRVYKNFDPRAKIIRAMCHKVLAALGRSRQRNHAMSMTMSGARLASSVEAAMEVSSSDQCHSARSPAKNAPANAVNQSRVAAEESCQRLAVTRTDLADKDFIGNFWLCRV